MSRKAAGLGNDQGEQRGRENEAAAGEKGEERDLKRLKSVLPRCYVLPCAGVALPLPCRKGS